MGEWFQGLLDGVWNFVTYLWEAVSNGVGAVISFFWDIILWFWSWPIKLWTWVWDNYVKPNILSVAEDINELPFAEIVEGFSIGALNIGGLLTRVVDINVVMAHAIMCLSFLAALAAGKFLIKLIPGVG